MDKSEIQAIIDRLEVLKKRHIELIDEQLALTRKIAESAKESSQAREYLATEGNRAKRGRERRKR
jgi:hypothetical protein